ncbi:hypothetical protein RIF29_25578 [Crotalaria pallida]|uniref:Uncharacterized protein n=1 Tax=Crotalaria pallida TaxID=3830 RepID=A0AAN9HZX0_CROPI
MIRWATVERHMHGGDSNFAVMFADLFMPVRSTTITNGSYSHIRRHLRELHPPPLLSIVEAYYCNVQERRRMAVRWCWRWSYKSVSASGRCRSTLVRCSREGEGVDGGVVVLEMVALGSRCWCRAGADVVKW